MITDALDTPAVTNQVTVPQAAVDALRNGVDMVLAAGTISRHAYQTAEVTYEALLSAAKSGRLPSARIESAYQAILSLKRRLHE